MFDILVHKITSNGMAVVTFMGITYVADMSKGFVYGILGPGFTRPVVDGLADFIKFVVYQHMTV